MTAGSTVCWVALFSLGSLLVTVIGTEEGAPAGKATQTGSPLVELTEANFQPLVFPDDADSAVPCLIMFYTPTCSHCTSLKSVLSNASVLASEKEWEGKAASFALFDATKSFGKLTQLYGVRVRSHPTLYYSIRGKLHLYEGGMELWDFVGFARLLWLGMAEDRPTGIIDDLSRDPMLTELEHGNAPVISFLLPSGHEGLELGRAVTDATMSFGEGQFAFITPAGVNILSSMDHPLAKELSQGMRKHQECRGPLGSMLLVRSDAFRDVTPFCGTWFKDQKETASDRYQLTPELKDWMKIASSPALRVIGGDIRWLSAQHKLVLVVAFNGEVPPLHGPSVEKSISVLRSVAQHLNLAVAANPANERMVVGVLDGTANPKLMASVDIHTFPSMVVLNYEAEEAFYLPEALRDAMLREANPWESAQTQTMIKSWLDSILKGQAAAEKVHCHGKVAASLRKFPLARLWDLIIAGILLVVIPRLLWQRMVGVPNRRTGLTEKQLRMIHLSMRELGPELKARDVSRLLRPFGFSFHPNLATDLLIRSISIHGQTHYCSRLFDEEFEEFIQSLQSNVPHGGATVCVVPWDTFTSFCSSKGCKAFHAEKEAFLARHGGKYTVDTPPVQPRRQRTSTPSHPRRP
jgi:hypothetical protein